MQMARKIYDVFKVRQKVGKYRVERKLATGGFATVYQALDTIEGIRVALKVPHATVLSEAVLRDFRNEARLTAQLDHFNILPLKNASFIDGRFVIVSPLGERTLADRLRSRVSFTTAMQWADQILDAVAYAHRQKIIHCDIKPENLILFQGNRLRLTDFGIAKVALRTVKARGTGTVGFMAPEQAAGKPTLRSDVFSLGLVLWRMFAGHLPEWPYHWPPTGYHRLRNRAHPDFIQFLRKTIEPDPRKRFIDADQMLTAFRRLRPRTLAFYAAKTRRRAAGVAAGAGSGRSSHKRRRL